MTTNRNNELKVLTPYLSGYEKQFYVRELSRLLQLPLKSVQNYLLLLENKGILKSKLRGKNKYYLLNMDNPLTKMFILHAETHKTIEFLHKYPLLKTFLKQINTNTLIVVFGSYAKDRANKNSDIDLFLVSREDKMPYHLLPYKAHEISLSQESFRIALLKKEPLLMEIEENHVILNNHSLYINTFWDYYAK